MHSNRVPLVYSYADNDSLHSTMVVYSFAVPSAPPLNVTVVNATSELVTLTWYPPLREHRNGIITGYLINLTVEVAGDTVEFSSNTTNLTVDGLMPYTTYLFIVAAETIAGTGPFSLIVSVRTEETGMTTDNIVTP